MIRYVYKKIALAGMERMRWREARSLGKCQYKRLIGSYCSGLVKIVV